jgi:F0F1-type ATP synthase membrane subunit c/vacuolar-type H+-ATPase subunit K
MERIMGVIKRVNIGLIVVAAILLSCAPLVFVGSAFGQNGDHVAAADGGHSGDAKGEDKVVQPHESDAKTSCWAFMAAALATGLGSIAAGYAVSNVGTAAMGAVAEKPELMGKSLIYVALAEGIAIYGLLIAIIVLAKV